MASLNLIWEANQIFHLRDWASPIGEVTATRLRRLSDNGHVYGASIQDNRVGHRPQIAVVKMAWGPQEMAGLDHEVNFYRNELAGLQGSVVPVIFGYYKGRYNETEVGCLLMEYCVSPSTPEPFERYRRMMVAACKLHQAGVAHNDLLDARHFVFAADGSFRVVDFAKARRHNCDNSVPSLASRTPVGCRELDALEKKFGRMSDERGAGLSNNIVITRWLWK